MRTLCVILLLTIAMALAACGQGPEESTRIEAIPANPADRAVAAIDAVEIVPGLSKRVLAEGNGPIAESGQTAVVHYTGWLYDAAAPNYRGAKFDSSVDRGTHFRFPLGAGRVIKGWDQGVVGMKVGEIRELTIAPAMGYGDRGAPPVIPPGATLVFVVELAAIEGSS